MIFRVMRISESQLPVQSDSGSILRCDMEPQELKTTIFAKHIDDLPDRFRSAMLSLMDLIDQKICKLIISVMQREVETNHSHNSYL